MEGNPFVCILETMRGQVPGQIPVNYRIGEVKSGAPLQVTVDGTIQSGAQLLKNADLGELHSGDAVVLLPFDDDQRHIILCRVVNV